ncbi:MAG TPA: hypothetical protein VGX70_11815 [Gemmataceae bacterium]|nr:hypothetical protein [Gemmataceae bacterium]
MTSKKYYRTILDTLQGESEELRAIPRERQDWAGSSGLIRLYRKTSGKDRSAMIHAIGQVIQNHPASPAIIAQLVDIASGLDLAEVEPEVRKLQAEPFGLQEPLRGAIINFLAFRQLTNKAEQAATGSKRNGKLGFGKAKSNRNATLTDGQQRSARLTRGRS